jgi:hypothetical protein
MPAMQDSNAPNKPSRDLDPVIEAYKKDVDVTLIRENLRLNASSN